MKRRHIVYCLFIILATFLYGLARHSALPDVVPVHWGVAGKPDGWAGKAFLLWFAPVVQTFLLVLIAGLAALPSQARRVSPFADAFGQTIVAFIAFFAWLEWLMVEAALGRDMVAQGIMAAMFLLFAFVGRMMGKVRRNSLMGIRTPWTLGSDQAWDGTHRWAAKFMVAVALVGLVATLAGASFWIQFALLTVWALGPVLYSLRYRRS